jgi:hypothetical protein
MRRLSLIPITVLLIACLAVLPASEPPQPAGGAAPVAVKSDHVFYAHLNMKAVRDSALFTELKRAVAKAGGMDLWDKIEGEQARLLALNFRPTELDSVTFCVPEVSLGVDPKFVLILVSSKPFNKTRLFGLKEGAKPDERGFYTVSREERLHLPDDKTAVLLHSDLAQKYLDGYAKDRATWPMTAELTKAASGHVAFAHLNVQKLPIKDLPPRALEEFGALAKAQTVTLTADLKDKELVVAGRATFPDADTAKKAKDIGQKFVAMAAEEVEKYTKLDPHRSDDLAALDVFKPVFKEAHRAVKEAKLEVTGSDLTLAASYKADFDIPKLVADAVKEIREAAPRISAQNNLRQCALGLLSFSDANDEKLPINGTGPKGALPKNANEKPLLSWRVALLPFIEENNLYQQFKLDEPWNSEHNKKLIEQMPKVFARSDKKGKPGYTHVQMVLGPKATQPGLSLEGIKDGTANTIALVEAAEPVIWTQPDDVVLPKDLPKDWRKKFGGLFPGGFNVALWDGSARFIPDTMSDRTLLLALDPNDGEKMPAEWGPEPPKIKR